MFATFFFCSLNSLSKVIGRSDRLLVSTATEKLYLRFHNLQGEGFIHRDARPKDSGIYDNVNV